MVDVVKTRTDLIERAAVELGALPSGETLADEDHDTIDNLVDPLVLQLSIDGIAEVSDTEAIPSEWFIPLARLLANEAAPSFGQQTNPDVKLQNERLLRRLTATRPTYETLKGSYF